MLSCSVADLCSESAKARRDHRVGLDGAVHGSKSRVVVVRRNHRRRQAGHDALPMTQDPDDAGLTKVKGEGQESGLERPLRLMVAPKTDNGPQNALQRL